MVPTVFSFEKSASRVGSICYLVRLQLLQSTFQAGWMSEQTGSPEMQHLETSSGSLSENNQTLRNPNSRSICLQAVSPASQIYRMKARSKQFCNRFNAAWLEQNVWFCISTLQLDELGGKQGSSRKCRSNDTSDSHMADRILVYSRTKNVHTTSIVFTITPKPITKSPERKNPLVKSRSLRLVAWKITWNQLLEGISVSAPKLISMSRGPGSVAGYESAWNKWVSWYYWQQIDPVCAFVSGILKYLSTLFEKDLQYQTINSLRSAISPYHDYVDGKPAGNILEPVFQ